MRMPKVAAAVPALLLVLGACSGGTTSAEDEACWDVHAWLSDGGGADLLDRVDAAAQELRSSDHGELAVAATELADSAEPDRETAAAALVEQCEALGWEPREG